MSWTKDMDSLCVARRLTRSRREAVELISTWRAPPRPPPEPTGVDVYDEEREDPPQERRRRGRRG